MELISVLLGLLGVSANALAAIVWGLLSKARKDIEQLKKEGAEIKFNYLDRFDELKDCIKSFELKVIEKITKLETTIINYK